MSFFDDLLGGTGRALADIRQKAIEEPWFGRAVTASPDQAREPHAERPDLMRAFFEGREVSREELHGKEPEPSHTHDLGYDR